MGKFASFIRNIISLAIAYLIAKLIYTLYLLGIQLEDVDKTMETLTEILKALAKKLGVRI